MAVIEDILELARWAPSGDNTQPWRFEIVDEAHLVVHGHDTREHCVYDLDGHPSQLAIGCLLETLAIAASAHGLRADIVRRSDLPDTRPTFDVRLVRDSGVTPDPLLAHVTLRTVQRRPMSTRPLSMQQRDTLEGALPAGYRVIWKEGWANKWRAARLMSANAKVRLTAPEAYRVHREIIEWNARYSEDKVPDQAIGLDPMTLKLMRWAMQSWERVDMLNTYFMGTLMPRLQLDLLPGLACAAHFGLVADEAPATPDDYVAAGRAVQRFWLTATRLGLQLQPEMTPVIFSRYIREARPFTTAPAPARLARHLAKRFDLLFGSEHTPRLVFVGRIGAGEPARARSLRLPITQLLQRE